MPIAPKRYCKIPGCGGEVERRGYCPGCSRTAARYDRNYRGSSSRRGYGYRWQQVRNTYIRNNPLCADPFGIHRGRGESVAGKDVDHIVPIRRGGTNAYNNLQTLCRGCHARKTDSDRAASRRAGDKGVVVLSGRESRPSGEHLTHDREFGTGGVPEDEINGSGSGRVGTPRRTDPESDPESDPVRPGSRDPYGPGSRAAGKRRTEYGRGPELDRTRASDEENAES